MERRLHAANDLEEVENAFTASGREMNAFNWLRTKCDCKTYVCDCLLVINVVFVSLSNITFEAVPQLLKFFAALLPSAPTELQSRKNRSEKLWMTR